MPQIPYNFIIIIKLCMFTVNLWALFYCVNADLQLIFPYNVKIYYQNVMKIGVNIRFFIILNIK